VNQNHGILSSPSRPDLDEFLGALGGFLEKPSTTGDPSNLRFLSMFCRSIGASEGHFLRRNEFGNLSSINSVGVPKDFDQKFNTDHLNASNEPSPLDEAFQQKEVIAIVELKKEKNIPPWFMKIMNDHGFNSLVAVPLIGSKEPVGILCAYYHDVCLFDQNTMDHLMTIGRMVGSATEKTIGAERAVSLGAKDKVSDEFLKVLTTRQFSKAQVYDLLAKFAGKALSLGGVVCGPIRRNNEGLTMTVAGGYKISSSLISTRIVLPPFIGKSLMKLSYEFPQNRFRPFGFMDRSHFPQGDIYNKKDKYDSQQYKGHSLFILSLE